MIVFVAVFAAILFQSLSVYGADRSTTLNHNGSNNSFALNITNSSTSYRVPNYTLNNSLSKSNSANLGASFTAPNLTQSTALSRGNRSSAVLELNDVTSVTSSLTINTSTSLNVSTKSGGIGTSIFKSWRASPKPVKDEAYPSISSITTGTGIAFASACASLQQSWLDASSLWRNMSVISTQYSVATEVSTYPVYTRYNRSCSYLCDGHCHLSGVVGSSMATTTRTYTTPVLMFPSSASKPSCTIGEADCTSLLISYNCATSLWYKTENSHWISSNRYCDFARMTQPTLLPTKPLCYAPGLAFGSNTVTRWRASEDCGQCTIFAGQRLAQAELIYFPVTNATNKNMCATTLTDTPAWGFSKSPSLTPLPTSLSQETAGQEGAVLDGTTYWANSAYVRFHRIEALDNCGNVGPMLTSALVTLRSSEVFSNRGALAYDAYTFNFADLVPPIPWIAWRGMQDCWEDIGAIELGKCSIVYDDEYSAQIAMPQQVRTLHPEWANCEISRVGLGDPPIALSARSLFSDPQSTIISNPAVVTTANKPVWTPPAVPASSPEPDFPTKTGDGRHDEPRPTNPSSTPDQNLRPNPGAPSVDPASNMIPSYQGGPLMPIATTGTDTVFFDPSKPKIIVIGGTTYELPTDGSGTLIKGKWMSLGSGNLVIEGSTVFLPQSTPRPIMTVGNEVVYLDPSNPGAVKLAGVELIANGPGKVIAGKWVSLSSNNLVIDGTTIAIPRAGQGSTYTSQQPNTGATLTLSDGTVITITPFGVVIGSTTLHSGGPALTLAGGKTLSLAPSGVIIAGPSKTSTVFLPSSTTPNKGHRTSSSRSVREYSPLTTLVRYGYILVVTLLLVFS